MLDALSIRAKLQDWQTRATQNQSSAAQARSTMSTVAANVAAILTEYNAAAADIQAYVTANPSEQHVADSITAVIGVVTPLAKVAAGKVAILNAVQGIDLSAGLTADNVTALKAAIGSAIDNAAKA
jgi:hypothetical protein